MSIASNEKILYTVKEVSQLIHTNQAYVYSLIKVGLLPVLKLGSYKVRRESLNKFLADFEGKDLTDPNNVAALNHGDVAIAVQQDQE